MSINNPFPQHSDNIEEFIYIPLKHSHQEPSAIPPWIEYNQVIYHNKSVNIAPSAIHYLPLIEAPATYISTINTILSRTIDLADRLELPKIVAVFDLAIYSKIQHIRWNDRNENYYKRIIVRLGEFHTVMSFLSILGKRFGSGGLTDLWVEADVVAAGSINGALSGKHYNRAIRGHKVVYEALCRIQLEDYLSSCSDERVAKYQELANSMKRKFSSEMSINHAVQKLSTFYTDFKLYVSAKETRDPT